MIRLNKNLKLVFVLLFSTSTIFFSKTASARIQVNTTKLNNSNSASKLEFSQTSEKKNSYLLIADLEPLDISPESEIAPLAYVLDDVENTKVADLSQKNIKVQSCTPQIIKQAKFTKISDLEQQNNHSQPCNPHIIKLAESTPKQIDPQPQVDELDINPTSPIQKPPQADKNYIIPPRLADKKKIRPLTTTIPLNGILINHLTERQLTVGAGFGDNQNTNFNVNGIINLNSQIKENLTTNNIFTVDQTGEYLQLQTVRKSREITVSVKEPQTVLGTELQLSLTASCILPGTNPEDICTYTPGLVSADINPDTFTPTRINQTSNVGDVVTPETLAAIQQPGFQTGANGQEIGIDLLLPNTGSFVGNSTGDQLSITRREEIENTPTAIYSRIRQIVKVNDREAVLGRTIRGFGLILNDENTLLNTALQLGYNLFPDVEPSIAGSSNRVNSNVNNNLFLAANNIRLPANSFTAYYGGIGRAQSVPPKATNLRQVPAANFNGIWLGASPIIKRSSNINTRFEQVGPPTIVSEGGGEGGFDSNISFVSNINNQNFSTANLQNFYTQVYVTILNQEVNNVTASRFREETNYAPHLSFTGNITRTSDVLRYYTGVIGADEIKVYGGADFTRNTANGWTFSGGLTGYINPDVDYYSQVIGSVAKRIPFSRNNNLMLSTAFNYALDRETRPNDFVNSLTFRTRVNLGNVWFGLTNFFGDILPDSINNTLVTSFGIQVNRNLALSGYYTPINENAGRSVYGASARFTLGKKQNSPILSLSWRNNQFDNGTDIFGNRLGTSENVFSVFLQGNF
ncbi:hypothetical protein IQ243_23055 [Nostocales cyanobacterium LEGE 11386]|nr:hypothetical protein [Nostocales cyanobacterium LEGE 11386]